MGTISTVVPESKRSPQRIGTRLQFDGTLALSSSYATGGDTIAAATLGMTDIMGGIVACKGGYLFELIPQTNPATAKVKAYKGAAGVNVEETNTTDLSAIVPYASIHGR